MPTFRSIGVLPSVSNRLVTESVVVGACTSFTTETINEDNDNNKNSNKEDDSSMIINNSIANNKKNMNKKMNNNNNCHQYHTIETPHAMLCRNPASIKMLKKSKATIAMGKATTTTCTSTCNNSNDDDDNTIVKNSVESNETYSNTGGKNDDNNNNKSNESNRDDNDDCVNDYPTSAVRVREQQQLHEEEDSVENQHAETIPLKHVLNMKHDVAVAIMRQSYNGQIIKHIRNEIDNRNKATKRIKHNQDNNNDDNNNNSIHNAFAFPGTISAFEMIQYQELIPENVYNQQEQQQQQTMNFDNNEYKIVITTGCIQIDELIAIPEEYTTMTLSSSSSSCQNTTTKSTKIYAGGVPMGYVTQVSGSSGCGKTQLALQLVSNSIGIYQTWYLSSDASIHYYAQRLAQLAYLQFHNNNTNHSTVNEQQQQQQQQNNISWMNTVLERTHFSHVTNEYEVLAELNRLDSFLLQNDTTTNNINSNNNNNICRRPIILVIDSVAGCITPGDNNKNTSSLLSTVANTIKRITRLHSIVTFLINGTVSNSITHNNNVTKAGSSIENIQTLAENQFSYNHQRTTKPALGRSWLKSAIDIQLWIETLPNGLRRISLDRHPSKKVIPTTSTGSSEDRADTSNNTANPHSVLFRLSEKGVCSVV